MDLWLPQTRIEYALIGIGFHGRSHCALWGVIGSGLPVAPTLSRSCIVIPAKGAAFQRAAASTRVPTGSLSERRAEYHPGGGSVRSGDRSTARNQVPDVPSCLPYSRVAGRRAGAFGDCELTGDPLPAHSGHIVPIAYWTMISRPIAPPRALPKRVPSHSGRPRSAVLVLVALCLATSACKSQPTRRAHAPKFLTSTDSHLLQVARSANDLAQCVLSPWEANRVTATSDFADTESATLTGQADASDRRRFVGGGLHGHRDNDAALVAAIVETVNTAGHMDPASPHTSGARARWDYRRLLRALSAWDLVASAMLNSEAGRASELIRHSTVAAELTLLGEASSLADSLVIGRALVRSANSLKRVVGAGGDSTKADCLQQVLGGTRPVIAPRPNAAYRAASGRI